MEIKISPRHKFPGRGPCIQMIGDWVTVEVWGVVSRLMNDNWITSEVYKARQKCHAFFQSGSDNSRGKWILIEFWAEEEKCQDFIKILNEEVNKVIKHAFTRICLVAKTSNEKDIKDLADAVELIVDDTKCPLGDKRQAEGNSCSTLFLPRNNLEYSEVWFHVEYTFHLQRLAWLDEWEVNNKAVIAACS